MSLVLNKYKWNEFEVGDIFLVDRGFRDSLQAIEKKGFVAKMPYFADKPSAQLSTMQANASRLVTKSRYVVELVNGIIKQLFKYVHMTIHSSTVSDVFEDFKIACAIYNCIFTPISSKTSKAVTDKMLRNVNEENKLANLVIEEKLNKKRNIFKPIQDLELHNFPRLQLDDLTLYTCGSYQLKMARSYYAQHVSENDDFKCDAVTETQKIDYSKYGIDIDPYNAILLKARISSKHFNAVKYFVYILVDTRSKNIDSIRGHYCACKVGKRVVGCCSHVALLLWYFSYARFLKFIHLPSASLSNIFMDKESEYESDNEEEED